LGFAAFSHMRATFGMVEELVRRGHRVTHLVPERFTDRAGQTGARVVSYPSAFPESLTASPTTMLVEFVRESFAPLEAALACAAEGPPDLVVHDALASDTAAVVSRMYGVPTVRTYAGFGTNPHVPLNGTEPDPTRPPADPADPRVAELSAELTDRIAAAGVAHLLSGELASGDGAALNISFVTREFQIKGETFGDDYLFAGPCLSPSDFAGRWSPPVEPGPLLLVSLGTSSNQRPEFFRTCARTFEETPWHVVMTLGRGVDPADIGPLPSNVETHQWLPHLVVLEHVSVFVTQGGTGSLMEAFYQGVPVVVAPQQTDQLAIARQVEALGLGRSLGPGDLDARALRAAVEAVAADDETRRRAGLMRRSLRTAPGPAGVVDRLEALMSCAA
jgi:MGT family glycosyltransferase